MRTTQHQKTASILQTAKDAITNIPKGLGPGFVGRTGLALLSGLAIPAGAYMFEERNRAKAMQQQQGRLVESYKAMLEMHPALSEHRDTVRVQRMFNTLANVNPTIAADPHAAGAYIRRAISDDELDTGAGAIALVDMASRFDASKAQREPALRPWQRAEAVSTIGSNFFAGMKDEMGHQAKRLEQEALARDPLHLSKQRLEVMDVDNKLEEAAQKLRARAQRQQQLNFNRP